MNTLYILVCILTNILLNRYLSIKYLLYLSRKLSLAAMARKMKEKTSIIL